jgi:nucleoside-diphosphate-sugar epimerase
VRAFLAATDLSRFLTDHMDAALESGQVVVNVGNPDNRTTVSGLAERVRKLLGSSSPIVRVDARTIHGPMYEEAESFHKVPVLGVASALGWKPELDLDGLILQTAEYYRRRSDERADRAAV